MQYIAEDTQVSMLLDTGMAGHEAFEEFARHQVFVSGRCCCLQAYCLNQDVI
jgi:hypothetical protein